MRGPTRDELVKTPPPELRMSSKTTQAYLELRTKLLTGGYTAGQVIVPKDVEEEYRINNTSTQILLMRLANEGLVQVLPIKERTWPNNAALNLYRAADLSAPNRVPAHREETALPEIHGTQGQEDAHEILLLKIQYADAEIASSLDMAPGDRVVLYRERLRDQQHDVVAIIDSYLPFWFAEMLPELEQGTHDVYHLLRQQGKHPATCSETVEVTLARSVERVLFELSPDDPAPLLKVQRRTLDTEGHPLAMQFLTLKPEHYRLHYSNIPLKEPAP